MATASHKRVLVSLVVLLVGIFLCGGCSDLRYHKIFGAGLLGAGVGAIVGHQSDECGNGALIGAAVFATGELLCQIDHLNEEKKVEKAADEVARGDALLDPTRREQ